MSARRRAKRLAIALLVAALLLRLHQLGLESIWFDEASSLHNASTTLDQFLPMLIQSETNPPLYFLMLRAWTSVLGNAEVSARLLSVVADMLGLGLLFLLGRELLGDWGALLALFLGAISRFEIYYAQEARMYAWHLTFCLGSALYYWRSHRAQSRRDLLLWLGFSLAAIYTHLFGWLILGSQAAHHLLMRRPIWGARAKGLVLLAALFAPWGLLVTVHQMQVRRGQWWVGQPDIRSYYHLLWRFSSSAGKLMVAILCCLVAYGLIHVWRTRNKQASAELDGLVFLLSWFLSPVVIWLHGQLMTPVFVAHYFLFCLPAYWLLIAQGLDRLPRVFTWAAVVLILTLTAPRLAEQYEPGDKYPWREIVSVVEGSRPRVEQIYITGGVAPFLYYAERRGLEIKVDTPLVGQITPRYLGPDELSRKLADTPVFWLLLTHHAPQDGAGVSWFKAHYRMERRHPRGLYLCRRRERR